MRYSDSMLDTRSPVPFVPSVRPATPLREAITSATLRREIECLAPLVELATLAPDEREAVRATATMLVKELRDDPEQSGVAALVQEYGLSSSEGVALMCLAEALLRIPDAATRDAVIRDKVAPGDWNAHLGNDRPLFVNAATWGLLVTGRLTASMDEKGLGSALTRLIARTGEPVVRKAVEAAMRAMGEQFVTGETIEEAIKRGRAMEKRGYSYSYDMLGEAAITDGGALQYCDSYEEAIHAIGKAAKGQSIYDAPGVSVKLSALHPRYEVAKAERVMDELLPRLSALAHLARDYGIGFNIDAEEADRLELSLDLLESLALDPGLAGWDGLGFVVQAYGKRCPFVIDWLADLAQRSDRRIMVRLVKGAYWDSEIKRGQVQGLAGYPVYTRKSHTDISYIACARKLLAAREHLFPQFATHNAQTVATIYRLAGEDFAKGDYEFQCLHGMGETLYKAVVRERGLNRPVRIYAPVGNHDTLLAYLVRRLLENGANSSFVNRLADKSVSIDDLIESPVDTALAQVAPLEKHSRIDLPEDIYETRRNSEGLDLSDAHVLGALSETIQHCFTREWEAVGVAQTGSPEPVYNPADHRDIVGEVTMATEAEARAAVRRAAESDWSEMSVEGRARILERAADAMQADMPALMSLAMREAGKTAANAVGEVREAIDFLRYYATRARSSLLSIHRPVGPVVAISPWNFPLAIFTGQVSAALAAGNPVLAKPAEETPLIAAEAVRILHACGVPEDALQLVPGDGGIGAALVAAPEVGGVLFTGSGEAAHSINRTLAKRMAKDGRTIPLVAETGGQNAMIVDSSALAEQVVRAVVSSAFDSAGQRCSALRVLYVQEDVADRTLDMLRGAMEELSVGKPDRISIDIGPVITAEARDGIEQHVEAMTRAGHPVFRIPLGEEAAQGTFVAPTLIEIDTIDRLEREVFGPVLHVIRYKSSELDAVIDAINSTGYGLTCGISTRIDRTANRVRARVEVGNVYVNRNIIGATVGVQPFGGCGLSGTGPKAGGPLYLGRLVVGPEPAVSMPGTHPALTDFAAWLRGRGETVLARAALRHGERAPGPVVVELAGPVGEDNLYSTQPRGIVLVRPATREGLFDQLAAALATGNRVLMDRSQLAFDTGMLPPSVRARIVESGEPDAALLEGREDELLPVLDALARRPGAIVHVQAASRAACEKGGAYRADWLVHEKSVSIDTTASGGNASLLAIA